LQSVSHEGPAGGETQASSQTPRCWGNLINLYQNRWLGKSHYAQDCHIARPTSARGCVAVRAAGLGAPATLHVLDLGTCHFEQGEESGPLPQGKIPHFIRNDGVGAFWTSGPVIPHRVRNLGRRRRARFLISFGMTTLEGSETWNPSFRTE
jgi:hypothetical protein